MTPAETLTLAAYFFVVIVLAIYGWHRYYLVYLYMSNRDKEPRLGPALDPLPVVTIQLPLYNEMYVAERLIDAVCAIRIPARSVRDPGAGRLDRRNAQHRRTGGAPLRGAGRRHQVHPPARSHRLQGWRARSGAQGRPRRVRRHLRRRLHPDIRLSHPADAAFRQPQGRHGAGALGAHQPGTTRC